MSRPLVIGHRGFAGRYPENTVEAVAAAVQLGADGVEVDVRPTAEGVWVCHHDRTREGRAVSQWRYPELAASGVASLAAVLETLPQQRWLFLEVKPLATAQLLELLDPLARLLAPRVGTLRFLSSSVRVLALLRQAFPRALFSWVITRLPQELPPGLELSPHHRLVEKLAGSGVPLHPWTLNQKPRMAALAQLGVASLTTNFPDRALELFGG